MFKRRRQFRLAAWFATLAIALGALAPAVSQAMTVLGDGHQRWIEVCSASGMAWIAADADSQKQGDDKQGMSTASCPYCCPHAGSFGLPPELSAGFAVIGAATLEPPLFFSAPRPLFAWTASSPRAPPSAS